MCPWGRSVLSEHLYSVLKSCSHMKADVSCGRPGPSGGSAEIMSHSLLLFPVLSFASTVLLQQSSWVIQVELAIGPEEGISYLTDKGSTVSEASDVGTRSIQSSLCLVVCFQPTHLANFTQVQSIQYWAMEEKDRKGMLQLNVAGAAEVSPHSFCHTTLNESNHLRTAVSLCRCGWRRFGFTDVAAQLFFCWYWSCIYI